MKALREVQLSHFLGCHRLSPAMLLLPEFRWLLNSLQVLDCILWVLLPVTRAVCAGLLHSACSEIFYYMASKIHTLFGTKKDNSSPVWPRKYQPTLQYCHAAFGSTFGKQRLEYPWSSCSLAVTADPSGTQATSWCTPSLSYMLLSHYMIHGPISRLHHIIPRFSKSFITICQSKAPAKAKGPALHPWCQAGWAALPLYQAGNVTQKGWGCWTWRYGGHNAATPITHSDFLMDSRNN